jgi:hypothetical protein
MKLLKDINGKSFEFLQKRILKAIEKHQAWFVANPAALQWLMIQWSSMYHAGAFCYKGECENNDRYEIEDGIEYESTESEAMVHSAFSKVKYFLETENKARTWRMRSSYTKADFDFFYQRYLEDIGERFYQLLEKKNKTMNEWVEIKTDPRYRYVSIYKNREDVLSHMLTSIGNGYKWDKDGFLSEHGEDPTLFKGWQAISIESFPKSCRDAIEQVLYSEKVQGAIERSNDYHAKETQSQYKRQRNFSQKALSAHYDTNMLDKMGDEELAIFFFNNLEKLGNPKEDSGIRLRYILIDSSPIMRLPDNVDQSYIDAAYEIITYIIKNESAYNDAYPHTIKHAKQWLKKYRKHRKVFKGAYS